MSDDPPTKPPRKTPTRRRTKSPRDALIDELLVGSTSKEGVQALLKDLAAAVVNRTLQAELADHLDYEIGEEPPENQSNRRNGLRTKQVRGDLGVMEIEVPRDREGSFQPQLIERYKRAIPGFDTKILSLYARGASVRDIRSHFEEVYGIDVSPDLISRVTDAVVDELRKWQSRPLDARYVILYVDALVVKVRHQGAVRNKSVYMAIGVNEDGRREALGLWIQETEGAKFWLSIFNELRQRGMQDVLFLCADGLKGLPEAAQASFPQAIFQTCVVHLIRASTHLVPWKDRAAVCGDLKTIYTAPNLTSADEALRAFEDKWSQKYPMVSKAWRSRFDEWTPFLDFSPEIRHAIYTTNVIEATNRQLRKVLKTKGHLPNDEAALKLIYLALKNQERAWHQSRHIRNWPTVRVQLAIHFEDRFPIEL